MFEPLPVHNTLVVVVHCDGEDLLCSVLTYHVLVERRFDVGGLGNYQRASGERILHLFVFVQGRGAVLNALFADQERRCRSAGIAGVGCGTRYEVLHRPRAFAAE